MMLTISFRFISRANDVDGCHGHAIKGIILNFNWILRVVYRMDESARFIISIFSQSAICQYQDWKESMDGNDDLNVVACCRLYVSFYLY